MKRYLILLSVLMGLIQVSTEASEYQSDKSHFSVKFDSNWKTSMTFEPNVELILVPNSNACSSTASITFGAMYDPKTRGLSAEILLKAVNGDIITRDIKNMPFIKDFMILNEGKTKLGQANAYKVLMSYTTPSRDVRQRKTFVTFNKGFFYNVSFHSTAKSFKSDYDIAEKVLKTFKLEDVHSEQNGRSNIKAIIGRILIFLSIILFFIWFRTKRQMKKEGTWQEEGGLGAYLWLLIYIILFILGIYLA